MTVEKSPGAFKTIGELSAELGVAQHILRYWESKFPQLRPLQRAGNRRYYRPADVDLARRINRLLNEEGYTVRGVQKLLRSKEEPEEQELAAAVAEYEPHRADEAPQPPRPGIGVERLRRIRDRLMTALEG